MVKLHLISTAILAIASVAPWTASALPVDITKDVTSSNVYQNGHPIMTNTAYARKQNLHPGGGSSLARRGHGNEDEQKEDDSEQDEDKSSGSEDDDKFPGKGHHHGHNKTEGEFPGRGHHWGHHKSDEEFPGRGGKGKGSEDDQEEKPTSSFPLTALPKPSNGGDFDLSEIIDKIFPSGTPKPSGDFSDIIKKIFPSGLPSDFPSGGLPSGLPTPTDLPSRGGEDDEDEEKKDKDDEKKHDDESKPAPTTTPQATTTTVKANPTSSTASVSAQTESPSSSSGSGDLSEEDSEALALHNQFRAKHSAPALVWNATLASYAKDWSDRCVFEHSSGPYGENLAMGYNDWKSAITAWYDEVSDYDFSNPGFGQGTGHFTQMVWVDTTQLGCGVADCSNGPMYTCSYFKPGNIVSGNEFKENVLPN
ncbi:CAP domain-containing protein [Phascolomyces articulosus]|uniref:CAP domain-containing protein n=1 Tax=Phascolomyces articulosus TaxID=60185 RepID=A0AAD5K6V7_9FUNG|nr:CAP domain-containing protein [Phascolomyces articulosus]